MMMAIRRDAGEDVAMTHLLEFKFSDRRRAPIDGITGLGNILMKEVDGSRGSALAGLSISQPLRPLKPSAHHPSPTLRCGTPFNDAFMPLVPLASSGLRGLLSQTSQPATRQCATCRS